MICLHVADFIDIDFVEKEPSTKSLEESKFSGQAVISYLYQACFEPS